MGNSSDEKLQQTKNCIIVSSSRFDGQAWNIPSIESFVNLCATSTSYGFASIDENNVLYQA